MDTAPPPKADVPTRTERVAVWGLTLLAFALRAWGTSYGFPQPWARPDELRWVGIALGLLEDPDPHWFQWPTLHAYVLAAVYFVWGKIAVAAGAFPTWHDFLNRHVHDYPTDLVLIGRVLSAITGALVVPATWVLGRRTGPAGAGLLGALFTAIAFTLARDAHWALIEPLLALLIVAGLLAADAALERPTLRAFVVAGLVAGVAMSAKYNALTLAAPIAVAVLYARLDAAGCARAAADRLVAVFLACGTIAAAALALDHRLVAVLVVLAGVVAALRHDAARAGLAAAWDHRGWLAALAMALAFVAGSPFMVVSRAEFKAAMDIREWSYRDASFGTSVGFVHHLLFSLRHGFGLPLEVAGIAGLAFCGLRDRRRALVTAYTLGTYLAIGPARIVPMRYASSLAPGIVLGAAWLLLDLHERGRLSRLAVAALALVLCVDPTYRLVRLDLLLSREDTRVSARRWMDARYPPGEAVLVRDSKAMRWGRPLLEDRYEVVTWTNRLARQRRTRVAMLTEADTGYVPFAPDVHELLRGVGTVVWSADPFAPEARPVYDPHDAFFVPVAGFEGVSVPGPRVTIWELTPPPPVPGAAP